MRRTKTTARRSCMVTVSSSSSEDDVSLGASQEEAPMPPTPSTDGLFQREFTAQRWRAFAAESIHPQVRGTVEGRPFNVSLLRF
jgi:hypothetical protein